MLSFHIDPPGKEATPTIGSIIGVNWPDMDNDDDQQLQVVRKYKVGSAIL